MSTLSEKLEQILKRITGRSISVSSEQSFKEELGIDSLTMVELVLATEEEFGIEFDQSDLTEENLGTTDAFLRLLERKL